MGNLHTKKEVRQTVPPFSILKLEISISRHRPIHLQSPSINPALQVKQIFKTRIRQIHRRMQAADAVVAVNDNRQIVVGQLVLAQRNQIHRDMDSIGQSADGGFLVGAHVQQMERAAFLLLLLQLQRSDLWNRHDVMCVK